MNSDRNRKLFYSKLKVLAFGDKVNSLPREVSDIMAPIHVRIKPTNACGHKCWYCAYAYEDLQLGKDMLTRDFIPEHKMYEIIEDLKEMNVQAVTFSGGGDPFYYRFLIPTIKRLIDAGIRFASLTNGARLSGELAELFAAHGTWLRISLDGWDDASYSEYRGVKDGEHTRLMKNMESFKKLGGNCFLGVSLIIDQKNAEHVYQICTKLKEIGVDSVKLSPCVVSNEGHESNRYHKPIVALVREQAEKAKVELADETFEVFDSYHLLEEKFTKEYDWCPYMQVLPVIGADQNIYACQDKAYNHDSGLIGSIKDKRFKDFWFSNKSKFFAINPARECNHHCVANEKNKLIFDYLNMDKEHLAFV